MRTEASCRHASRDHQQGPADSRPPESTHRPRARRAQQAYASARHVEGAACRHSSALLKTIAELDKAKNSRDSKKSELDDVREALDIVRSELSDLKGILALRSVQLQATHEDLTATISSLASTEIDLYWACKTLDPVERKRKQLEGALTAMEAEHNESVRVAAVKLLDSQTKVQELAFYEVKDPLEQYLFQLKKIVEEYMSEKIEERDAGSDADYQRLAYLQVCLTVLIDARAQSQAQLATGHTSERAEAVAHEEPPADGEASPRYEAPAEDERPPDDGCPRDDSAPTNDESSGEDDSQGDDNGRGRAESPQEDDDSPADDESPPEEDDRTSKSTNQDTSLTASSATDSDPSASTTTTTVPQGDDNEDDGGAPWTTVVSKKRNRGSRRNRGPKKKEHRAHQLSKSWSLQPPNVPEAGEPG